MQDLRAQLIRRLLDLRGRAPRIEEHRRAPLEAHLEEQALAAEDDPVVDRLDVATREEIAGLKAAIQRMNAGQYGICEVCEELIPVARLHAYPFATRCITHA